MRGPIDIPFPLSSFPGSTPQESAGRLINCHAEPLGPNGPAKASYHRAPGLSQFAVTNNSNYRGGLVVGNLSYETWSGNASTVDAGGNVISLGSLPGTKSISIARDQNATPHVIAVDPDNGAFTLSGGPPAAYNGGGNLPQPNSVTILDDQFVFGIADRRMFATSVNSLTLNSQTFATLSKKSDVTGQRVISFSGLLFGFTTGHCEVWLDTANAAPAFPFSFQVMIPWGLIQQGAIAGFETGFDALHWVAQDFGVYQLLPGSLTPLKVSPPDLDRLISAQVRGGDTLMAGCYAFAGKKFWVLSSSLWTWEFNLGTKEWNERRSLQSNGTQGAWRGDSGHLAFGKWLMGDAQSGKIGFIDETVITEFGSPQLRRIESAPVANFPNRLRVARADFNFSTGAGLATGAAPNIVNPSVAISWSDDDGINWKNPIVRSLGLQGNSLRTRVSVKNTGYSGPQARRWRLDDTDCAAPFMSATQSDDPKEY